MKPPTNQETLLQLAAVYIARDGIEGIEKLRKELKALNTDQQSSAPEASEQDDFEELLGQYWSLAYREGKEGVSHGTEANKVFHKLRQAARQARPCVPEWLPIESAPRDKHILAVVDGSVRLIRWGKTSHVPMYGFCLADQGVEDFDICNPTHWMPLPAAPSIGVQSNDSDRKE